MLNDEFLTKEQVAAILHKSPRTILGYIEHGEIEHVRWGRPILIPRSAVERKIKEMTFGPKGVFGPKGGK